VGRDPKLEQYDLSWTSGGFSSRLEANVRWDDFFSVKLLNIDWNSLEISVDSEQLWSAQYRGKMLCSGSSGLVQPVRGPRKVNPPGRSILLD